MSDPLFEAFVNTELPRRSPHLDQTITGYDGDPNDGGAPAILQNAPLGTWFRENTAGTWWRKTETVWVVGVGSEPGAVTRLHYRQGGTGSGPGYYTVFQDLYDAIVADRAAVGGFPRYEIVADDRDTQPCDFPAGTGDYDMTNVVVIGVSRPGQFGHTQINLLEGCVMNPPVYEWYNCDVVNRATATPPMEASNGDVFLFADQVDLSSLAPNAVPMVSGDNLGGGEFYTIDMVRQATTGNLGRVYDIFSVAAGAIVLVKVGPGCVFNLDSLRGPVGSLYFLDDGGGAYGPQANFLGTPNLTFGGPPTPRFKFDPAIGSPVITAATTISATAIARCSVGGGAFAVTLPAQPAQFFNEVGKLMVITEESGADGLTVAPNAGDTINGVAAAISVPGGGSAILACDGVGDWKVIAIYSPKDADVVRALARTTTTSSVFQNKATWSTGTRRGRYRINYMALIDNGGDEGEVRLQNETAATTIVDPQSMRASDNTNQHAIIGIEDVTLTGVSQDISIQFRDVNGGNTQGLQQARIAYEKL